MEIKVVENAKDIECDVLVVNKFEDELTSNPLVNKYAPETFKGKPGECFVIHSRGELPATNVLAVGFGKEQELDNNVIRESIAKAIRKCAELKAKTVAIDISSNLDFSVPVVLGAKIADYSFDKYKTKSMMIYVINNTKEAPTILDSTDKGLLKVEVVNETERAIFSLLDNNPLYINTVNNQISLLIVGCGVVGREFLKDATWCGTLIGYKFKALVSKGTYIRSLCVAICDKLGYPGLMNSLIRTKTGVWNIEESSTILDIEHGNFKSYSMLEAVKNLPSIEEEDCVYKALHGMKISPSKIYDILCENPQRIAIKQDDKLIAIYDFDKEIKGYRAVRVWN